MNSLIAVVHPLHDGAIPVQPFQVHQMTSDRRKKAIDFRKLILDKRLLAEIRHLLWQDPTVVDGRRDEGWMCREHAFFTAFLAVLSGQQGVTIINGRAGFAADTAEGHLRLMVDPRSWVGIPGAGFYDLSPNLAPCDGRHWNPWPVRCLAASRFYPSDKVKTQFILDQPRLNIEDILVRNKEKSTYYAVYLAESEDRILPEMSLCAFKYLDSPLVGQLRKLGLGDEIYANGVWHL